MADKKASAVETIRGDDGKVLAVRYDDGKIKINGVRCSYPHLFEKYAGPDGGNPAYSCTALLPKSTHRAVKDMLVRVIDALCKENKIKAVEKKFISDGDKKDKPECEGMFVVSARESKKAPRVRDNDKRILSADSPADRERIFAGCVVNVVISPWFQNNTYGKRVNANLLVVQFVKDDGVRYAQGGITDDTVDEILDDHSDEDDVDTVPDAADDL